MAAFVPITGPVTGSTIYVDNKLVARDASINLPEVTPMTADLQAGGTFTMPIWELMDNMEMSVTKIGVDLGFTQCIVPGMNAIEVRFTQTQTDANGVVKTIMCKAFIKGMTASIPSLGVEVGSATEAETTFNVTRYQLFVDGVEAFLVDRLAGIVRIGGTSYTDGLAGL